MKRKTYPSDSPEKQREYRRRYYEKLGPEGRRKRAGKHRKQTPNYYRNWHLQRRYGISLTEYRDLLAQQDGGCAICKTKDSPRSSFDVDHDHVTGAVRGLLCLHCNSGLGHFRDSPQNLAAAINYLLKERGK